MPDGSYRIGAEGGKVKITDQNIESRIEEINKELEKIRKVEKKFPQGELQCFKNENRYKWKIKEENGLRYLPKTERNQAEMLALKKYYECRKKELESEDQLTCLGAQTAGEYSVIRAGASASLHMAGYGDTYFSACLLYTSRCV